MRRCNLLFPISILLLSSFSVEPAHGQVLYGSIVGNVLDSSGGAVPNAKVTITDAGTNQSRDFVTNASGAFVCPNVAGGTYQVQVVKEGFQPFLVRDIVVQANSAVRVDATLTIGGVTQSVQVSAEAVSLQTDRADVHSEITSASLENLPLTGRSFQSTLFFAPGATQPDYFQAGGLNNPSHALTVSVNGIVNTDTVVKIDGITATNQHIPQLQAYTPAIEAIDTVNIVTSSFDAEQGMAGGASVNLQTRSGTNTLHGSAFEYIQNADLKARYIFLPVGEATPPANKNIFGGTLGGAIKKNKLFFFGSWEDTINHGTGQVSQSANGLYTTVPSVALRSGDFSGTGTTIYDPSTANANGTGKTPFPGDVIPGGRLNTVVQQNIIPLLPLPQNSFTSNNAFFLPRYDQNYSKVDSKFNWLVNSKLNVSARFSDLHNFETFNGFYSPGSTLNSLGLSGHDFGDVYSGSVGVTYTVTPGFLLDGVYGLTRYHSGQYPSGPRQCWGEILGIPNSCQPGQRNLTTPSISIANWMPIGGSANLDDYYDPQYEWSGNGTWIKGAHNLRFGADIHKLDQNHSELTTDTLTFTGGVTALNGGPAPNQYNSWADFLLGLEQSSVNSNDNQLLKLNNGGNNLRPLTLRTWEVGLYARDQWQVRRKLTASLGLRWEHYPVPTRADRGIELYDFATNKLLICGVGGTPGDCGIQVSPKLFAPRLGTAYRITETFVARAGFSLNWQNDNMYQAGRYNFPGLQSISLTGPNSYTAVGNISNGFPIITPVNITSGSVTLPAGSGITTLPQNYVRGYVMSWNFTLQKSLPGNFTVEAGYVGTRGVHLVQSQNVNYGLPGGGAASQPFYQSLGISAAMNVLLPEDHTIYDSLQTKITRRLSAGLLMTASYTWSKNIDDFAGTIPIPQYFGRNRGLSSIDIPNKFTLAAVYELPFGKGKRWASGGLGAAFAGGWQLGGVFSAFSGSDFTVTASAASLNAPGSPQNANQILPKVAVLGGVNPNPYFNPLAFSSVTGAVFGNAGFDTLRGPANPGNLDLNLSRSFRLTERIQMQFRAEAFNATNTPHFWSPGTRANTFTTSFTNNVSSMTLGPTGSVVNLNGYDQIVYVNALGRDYDERYFRLGLRLSF